jgi:uncharacterized protein (TIGR03083 family)
MTMTDTVPQAPALDRTTAMRLAETEYQRMTDLLRSLRPDDWRKATDCAGWDVRAMTAHLLGMIDFARSIRDQRRQVKIAGARGGVFIDALTGLQIEERSGMTSAQLVELYTARSPKAARGRRRAPGFVRRRPMPVPQTINGRPETWTIGYLVDVIFTRDPWMHRIDLVRATGAEHVLTAEHDGVIVADVVAEWGRRHGRPYTLHLTGPAGGLWSNGSGGQELELDALEFCRILSGRGHGEGLLATEVPF